MTLRSSLLRADSVSAAGYSPRSKKRRARRCCKVTLEVRDDNAPARSLYQRSGYGAALSRGASVQYLFLEKRLDAEHRE
jgi:ribosomal protein S18 acetylase RimI-like enzyme